MSTTTLLTFRLRVEQDIFIARQLGREVTRAVGLESQDQTRVATALSDRWGDVLGRLSFYTPYKSDDAQWDRVLADLKAI